MDNLYALFRISGAAAVFFLMTSAASGFWGSALRKHMSPQSAMRLTGDSAWRGCYPA